MMGGKDGPNGAGFPPEFLASFAQGGRFRSLPGTENEEGLGYGLRIVEVYVRRLQGEFLLRNGCDGGASAVVIVPAAPG